MILAAVMVAAVPFLHGTPAGGAGSVLSELESIGRAIARSEHTLEDLGADAERLTAHTTRADIELADARLRHATAFAIYRDRVRALARLPRGTLFVLFGESRSLADVLRAAKLLRRVATYDQAAQAALAREAEALRAASDRADEDRRALERVIERVRETRDTLAEQRRTRLDTIRTALASPARRATMERELAAVRSQLAAMLARATPTAQASFSALRGKLAWPAVGSLSGRFGETAASELGTATTRQGITIKAVVGDPVQAVAAGRVVYAGWMRGYGQVVVLDHGEHYHTVLAQLGSVSVQAGEQVTVGAEVGRVGDSGWQGGLAFELHRAGVAVDPLPWLKR